MSVVSTLQRGLTENKGTDGGGRSVHCSLVCSSRVSYKWRAMHSCCGDLLWNHVNQFDRCDSA